MHTAWENEEISTHLFSSIFHKIRICDNSGTMDLIGNRSDKHLLIFRCNFRHHARSDFTHHFRHALNLRRSDFRSIFKSISSELFLGDTVLFHELIGNKNCSITCISLVKYNAVDYCHVLHVLMRHILKKLSISFSGNNFHRKLALHLLIIGDGAKIKVRSLG